VQDTYSIQDLHHTNSQSISPDTVRLQQTTGTPSSSGNRKRDAKFQCFACMGYLKPPPHIVHPLDLAQLLPVEPLHVTLCMSHRTRNKDHGKMVFGDGSMRPNPHSHTLSRSGSPSEYHCPGRSNGSLRRGMAWKGHSGNRSSDKLAAELLMGREDGWREIDRSSGLTGRRTGKST
jgi:hypothetical protein